MLYSSKEIKDLLQELVERTDDSISASERLVYYLRYPKEEFPALVAEVISSDKKFISNQLCLGSFLARGHINELISLRDISLRAYSLNRISRQVNRVSYFLLSLETPAQISSFYSDIVNHYYKLMVLLDKNIDDNCNISKKDLHLLFLEEAITVFEKEPRLTKNLVEMLIDRLNIFDKKLFSENIYSILSSSQEQTVLKEEIFNISTFKDSKVFFEGLVSNYLSKNDLSLVIK